MKKYYKPFIEEEKLELEDIIMHSYSFDEELDDNPDGSED